MMRRALFACAAVAVLPACPDGFGFDLVADGFRGSDTITSAPKDLTLHVEPGVQQRFHVPLEVSGESFDATATLEVTRAGGAFLVAVAVDEGATRFVDSYAAADAGFIFTVPVLDPSFAVADGFEFGVAGDPAAAAFDVDVTLTAQVGVFDATSTSVSLGRLEPRAP